MNDHPFIVFPSFSEATRISSLIADNLDEWFRNEGYDTWGLEENAANPLRLRQELRNYNMAVNGRKFFPLVNTWLHTSPQTDRPLMLVYVGHGQDGALIGNERWGFASEFGQLLSTRPGPLNLSVVNTLRDAIVVTIACDSLQELGPWLVERGIGAYTGCSTPIDVSLDDMDGDDVPDIVKMFSIIPQQLALGATVEDAVEAMKADARARYQACACGDEDYCNRLFKNIADNYGYVGNGRLQWTPQQDRDGLTKSIGQRNMLGDNDMPGSYKVGGYKTYSGVDVPLMNIYVKRYSSMKNNQFGVFYSYYDREEGRTVHEDANWYSTNEDANEGASQLAKQIEERNPPAWLISSLTPFGFEPKQPTEEELKRAYDLADKVSDLYMKKGWGYEEPIWAGGPSPYELRLYSYPEYIPKFEEILRESSQGKKNTEELASDEIEGPLGYWSFPVLNKLKGGGQ